MANLAVVSQEISKYNSKAIIDRKKLVSLGMSKQNARQMTKTQKIPALKLGEKMSELEQHVGKGRAGHVEIYFENSLKRGFKFRRSDIMDLMQLCYAYDCDLFRCDKAMEHNFKNYEPFRNKLVGRFTELPHRIRALL